MKIDVKKRIDELVDNLNKWSDHYYSKNISLVSDEVYDAYLQELKRLEKSHPSFIRLDSPTRLVGFSVYGTKFKKVPHLKKRLSLNNAFNKKDLNDFLTTISKKIKDSLKYSCEYKIDGISLAITYKNGKLFQALTRGDGIIGEDVTHTARIIQNIPLRIPINKTINIRGEVYFPLINFTKRNKELKNEGKMVYKNPRNAVSGLLRQISIKNIAKAKLNIAFYDFAQWEEFKLKTQEDIFLFFQNNNIPYLNNYQIRDVKNIFSTIEQMIQKKNLLDLEIDGIVIKLNNLQKRKIMGITSKFPKWAIAYKLPQMKVKTKLRKIFITIGRTGKVTYNAQLDPVYLNGTIVKFATLHNYEWIKKKDIRLNDTVLIHKAGYIIPEILEVVKEAREETKIFKQIFTCPYCQSKLVSFDDEVDQYCINEKCEEIAIKKLTHFVSRDALQIFSISEEIIKKLFYKGWLRKIDDFFTLHFYFSKWVNEKGFQKKSIHNILSSLRKALNNIELDRLLFALGIKHLGKTTSKKIVNHFKTLNAITNASLEKFQEIKDIGEVVAKEVYSFFHSKSNLRLINKINLHFNLNKTLNIQKTSLLKNSKFVITGSLTNSREYYTKLIINNGGWVTSTISKKTTYLLVGDNPGSKLTKAKNLGIRIIKEKEFYNLFKK